MSELEEILAELVRQAVHDELASVREELASQQEARQWFNPKEAAEYTGKTVQAVRIASRPGGRLKKEKQGTSVAYSRDALDAWMRSGS